MGVGWGWGWGGGFVRAGLVEGRSEMVVFVFVFGNLPFVSLGVFTWHARRGQPVLARAF